LGLAFERKADAPRVIVNKTKWKEEIEGLELFSLLAKQVLSQLSYTPTVSAIETTGRGNGKEDWRRPLISSEPLNRFLLLKLGWPPNHAQKNFIREMNH
jgi:hypothetical protein